jgi:hypothetical protein
MSIPDGFSVSEWRMYLLAADLEEGVEADSSEPEPELLRMSTLN